MAQDPVAQVAAALARVHAVPHAPQLVSELREVSQPFVALASQLPKPASHAPRAQAPVAQLAAAFAREHAVPQLAQFASVVSAVSQPLAASASQLPKLALHVPMVQVPVEQLAAALARAHTVPQLAQFASVVSATSQPFESVPSQFPKPALHAEIAQEPVEHVGVALLRAQAAPHALQFVSEVSGASQPLLATPSQLP
jgi:hypothetical protein